MSRLITEGTRAPSSGPSATSVLRPRTVEVTGPTDKIDSMLTLLRPFGIKEMVRTGLVAMTRGAATVQQAKQPTPTRPTQPTREPGPEGLTHQLSA